MESDKAGGKLWIKYKWIIEKVADCENVVIFVVWEILALQSQKYRRIYWHKWGKWLWWKGSARESNAGKIFTLKEPLEIFHNLQSIKSEMFKADQA